MLFALGITRWTNFAIKVSNRRVSVGRLIGSRFPFYVDNGSVGLLWIYLYWEEIHPITTGILLQLLASCEILRLTFSMTKLKQIWPKMQMKVRTSSKNIQKRSFLKKKFVFFEKNFIFLKIGKSSFFPPKLFFFQKRSI